MIVLYLIDIYLSVGVIFSILFLRKWIYHVDDIAKGSHWTFKATILPGCVLLWPFLLRNTLPLYKTDRE
jgi:hypothetical protein